MYKWRLYACSTSKQYNPITCQKESMEKFSPRYRLCSCSVRYWKCNSRKQKEDKREVLWRLAVNYNNKNKDFTLIENYFIDKRDDYYLIELISAVKEDLDMEKLFKNVIATNDKEFMSNCYNRAKKHGFIYR